VAAATAASDTFANCVINCMITTGAPPSCGAQGQLVATLLAAIAQFEHALIVERTGAGRERATANGVKFGRKRKLWTISERRRSSGVLPARH
jgi:DNA invertase Pin-like site-specific DNA recombinase